MWDWLRKVVSWVKRAKQVVEDNVPEPVLAYAMEKVRAALGKYADGAARREWVVAELQSVLHVSESVSRLAVELAVQMLKKELA